MYGPIARHRPAHRWTDGDIAAKVGADLGLTPDEEQQWIQDAIFAEKAPDIPAAFEVGIVAPRQNIKSSSLEIAALMDLYVKEVPLHVWTAHELDTARKSFQDMRQRIERNPEYASRTRFIGGHQDMAIIVDDNDLTTHRKVLEFQARSGAGGRGWTCDRLTLDEALYLQPRDMGAILPTLVTRQDAQVRYASSAGFKSSSVLRGIRDRGRSGKDPRLAYVEYGAPRRPCAEPDCSHRFGQVEGCAADMRELWWAANCALWAGRITEESLEDQRRTLPPLEWLREFYSWWEDPVSEGGALPLATWINDLADPDEELGEVETFGLHVQEDRTAWITAHWSRTDGATHAHLANKGLPIAAHRVVAKCRELVDDLGGKVIAPKAFTAELEEAGVTVEEMPPGSWSGACGLLADEIQAHTIKHGNQAEMNEAIRAAEWRSGGRQGERAFKDCDGPLFALVRGLWGISGQVEAPPPPPPRKVSASTARHPIQTQGF